MSEKITSQQSIEEQSDLYEHHRLIVDPGQSLLRIDKFLVNRIENASRTKIQDAALSGNIRVNNHPVKSNYKVKPNDVISIVLSYPPREIELVPENIPIEIVYEDDDLILVNKASGMVVHPGYGNYTGTLMNAIAYHLEGKHDFDKNDIRAGLVHRIDKDTTGLLVIAKSEIAKNRLAMQFFNRSVNRKYIALVWGTFEEKEGTINKNLGRSLQDRKIMAAFTDPEKGKRAVTHYNVIEDLAYISKIECKLETGRTHQIRVHLQSIGHPLFNDETYGGHRILKGTTFTKYKQFVTNCFTELPRQALHAKSLGFIHPTTNEYLFFDSELPNDMSNVITKWRTYLSNREK